MRLPPSLLARTLSFLLFANVLCGTVGCGEKPTPSPEPTPIRNVEPTKADPPQGIAAPPTTAEPKKITQDLKQSTPDITITAESLTKEWGASSAKFLEKYNDKVIDISGPFEFYDLSFDGQLFLVLGPGINKFSSDDKDALSRAVPGQIVTLRARCVPGVGISVCTVVGAEGPKPPTYTADQLVKAFADNPAAMQEKLKSESIWGKCIIVTGQIQEVDKDSQSTIYMTKSDADPKLKCYMLNTKMQEFKIGQNVNIIGHYDRASSVTLTRGVVLPSLP